MTRTEENNAFGLRLLQQLLDSAASVRPSKADLDRFRYTSAGSLQARCYRAIKTLLLAPFREKSSVLRQGREWQAISHSMGAVGGLLNGLVKLYGRLSDRRSRELLIELIAFRILGEERVRLSLNTEDYWAKRASLKSFFDFSDCIPTGDRNETLGRINLSCMGYPITLYSIPIVIHTIFESKQYEYPECKPPIKACKGDVVVDVGGCWGDTALYFASEVGQSGRVFTFECAPRNLCVMKQNFALNPHLSPGVTVVERPVWCRSGEMLYFAENGPASHVSDTKVDTRIAVQAISLDDFVTENQIQRVDFIKMDIEGAELNALKGASEVIRTFRPKLAISLYHKLTDFVDIPEFIATLHQGYQFYLGHYTVHSEETVLFAVAEP